MGRRVKIFERVCEHGGSAGGIISWRGNGAGVIVGEEGNIFWSSFATGRRDIDSVASVVGHCWAEVPPCDAVWRPGAALSWGLVREDTTSWWAEGSFVEVEGAVDLSIRRKFWVDVRLAQEIKGEDGIWNDSAPEVGG